MIARHRAGTWGRGDISQVESFPAGQRSVGRQLAGLNAEEDFDPDFSISVMDDHDPRPPAAVDIDDRPGCPWAMGPWSLDLGKASDPPRISIGAQPGSCRMAILCVVLDDPTVTARGWWETTWAARARELGWASRGRRDRSAQVVSVPPSASRVGGRFEGWIDISSRSRWRWCWLA